jgi:hypothetical protein
LARIRNTKARIRKLKTLVLLIFVLTEVSDNRDVMEMISEQKNQELQEQALQAQPICDPIFAPLNRAERNAMAEFNIAYPVTERVPETVPCG